MRRLTALFVPKRSSKSDAGSSIHSETQSNVASSSADNVNSGPGSNAPSPSKPAKSRSGFFRSLSRNGGASSAGQTGSDAKNKRQPMPSLMTDPSSSASSSSGGPHTPDDDRSSLPAEPYRIPAWLHSASSAPLTYDDPRVTGLDVGMKQLPPKPSLPQIVHDDTDDDSSSDGSSESDGAPLSTIKKTSAQSPLAYFRSLTVNSISPPFSPPPLLHIPGCPVYPRSSNSERIVSTAESLRSLMFKKRLLRQIAGGPLTPSDEASIAAFRTRMRAPPARRPSLNLDDNAVKDARHLDKYSQGLRWWVDRPCFEERMVLYMPHDRTGEIQVLRITGSELGVAALEFSEGLEAMADLDYYNDSTIPLSTSLTSLPPTPPAVPLSIHSSPSMMASALPPPLPNKIGQQSGVFLIILRVQSSLTTVCVYVGGQSPHLHPEILCTRQLRPLYVWSIRQNRLNSRVPVCLVCRLPLLTRRRSWVTFPYLCSQRLLPLPLVHQPSSCRQTPLRTSLAHCLSLLRNKACASPRMRKRRIPYHSVMSCGSSRSGKRRLGSSRWSENGECTKRRGVSMKRSDESRKRRSLGGRRRKLHGIESARLWKRTGRRGCMPMRWSQREPGERALAWVLSRR